MFYTVKTPAGNVFYLVIDRQRGADNVYFLNAVTEYDLFALIDNESAQGNTSVSAIPTPLPSTPQPTTDGNSKEEKADDSDAENDELPARKSGNMGMLIFLLVGVAAVGGAAYYMKIIRPKQQSGIDDDDDDDIPEDDDSGEEMEFEDEPEEIEVDEDDGEHEEADDSDEDENEDN